MKELWGRRNVTRLAKESGVARESLSKILNHKRGVGSDVGPKLAAVLQLDPSDLASPQTEPATVATVLRRLEQFQAEADQSRAAYARQLEAIRVLLQRIEARLSVEVPSAQEESG